MSLPLEKRFFTPAEYLRLEREASYKSQYYAGEIFAMSGGSARHSLTGTNLLIATGRRLAGRACTAYNSDLRIAVSPDGLYTYPDISVFCEPIAFVPGCDDTAMNPAVVVEVLSPSTEAYDRGRKFEQYRRIASLREYLLVSQEAPLIERFSREDEGRWTLTEVSGLQNVCSIEALDIGIPLSEVYEGVDFPERDSSREG